MEITKQVVFVAKEGCVAEMKALLTMMVAPSRAEDGCELYNIYQMEEKPDTFVVIETWRDAVALKGHQDSEHYKHYKAHFEPFCAEKYSNPLVALV